MKSVLTRTIQSKRGSNSLKLSGALAAIPFIQVDEIHVDTSKKNVAGLFREQDSLSPSAAFNSYLSVVSGACLGMGLVFAGTDNESAKRVISIYLKYLKS